MNFPPPGYPGQPPYPSQPAPGGWPQQQQQPSYPQQPPQQQQQWGPPPGQPPGMPPPNAVPQQPQGLAQYAKVDDAAVMAALQRASEENAASRGGGFMKPTFVKVPGPAGQIKWGPEVPINYEGYVVLWLCPPFTAGAPLFVEQETHFYRSAAHPKGASIEHMKQGCQFCLEALAAKGQSFNLDLQKRGNDWSKVRRKYLYNVINLSNLASHYGQDGVARAQCLDAGAQLQEKITELIKELGGATNVVDYYVGRPVKFKKKKTGPHEMDVEYSMVPFSMNGVMPLDPQAYAITHNLWDLSKLVVVPSPEQVQKALQETGLAGASQLTGNVGAPAGGPSYNPTPQPPWGPPAQQQQQQQPWGPPPAAAQPAWTPPPQAPAPQPTWTPPPQQAAPWGQSGVPDTRPMGPPPGAPPMMQPPPPYQGAPPMQHSSAPPAGLNPPQLQSLGAPPAGAPPYMAQPSQPQGPTSVLPPAAIAQQGAQGFELRMPLNPSIKLPDSREACFSRPNMADRLCQTCPQWIQSQCFVASGAPPPAATAATTTSLDALQQQLAGG